MESAPDAQGSGITFNLDWAVIWGQVEDNPNDPVGSLNSLLKFCEYHGYAFAVRAAIDLVMQTTFPQYQADMPQIDLGYKVMAGTDVYGGVTFAPFQVTSLEAAFSWQEASAFVSAVLTYFDQAVTNSIYPAGYVSLRACRHTRATMGMQRAGSGGFPDCTGMVEISLIGNDNTYSMIAALEDLALQNNAFLHWGQSNGYLDAAAVARYPALSAFKSAQQTLGGATFTNLFMQRCGLA